MCILAIQYQASRDAPILVAQNRDEQYDRPAQPPRIQSGRPRVVCGIDRNGGGTWFGVNQHGLFVSVLNAHKKKNAFNVRSRGLLCRELLSCLTTEEAVERAVAELATGNYSGSNYVIADKNSGAVVYGWETVDVEAIRPGLHLVTENRMDDHTDERQEFVRRLLTLQTLDSSVAFLAVASRTFARHPDTQGRRGVVLVGKDEGTVSSSILSLTERQQNSIYQYAAGPPHKTKYDDISALLRQVLSTDRAMQRRAAQQ